LLFWRADWTFRGWYVNLETNGRTALGVDVHDHILDVWVTADGEVEWLDEDELAEGLELGAILPTTAAAARAEGERVLEEWPFPTGWEGWRPPPEWLPPTLPPGWDTV
jgi:predicted RNA-binding protein associated with RNAse of E/G family